MQRIDGHVHLYGNDTAAALLARLGMKALNICVADGNWKQRDKAHFRTLAEQYPEQFVWITSFDLPDDTTKNGAYTDRVIAELDADFDAGAVGCKAWKNIGMELRDHHGRYVMIDDPIFEPIFAHLEREGRSMVMHIGEPLACWQPLKPGSPHYGYYSANPQWHMFGRTDIPDHAAQIAARDHVLERHPNLRVIGAHYGSLEYDVAEVAKRFERYPNFAVDTSARLGDMAYQDREKVRDFFIRYQDRIIWGSDEIIKYQPDQPDQALKQLTDQYDLEMAFFTDDKPMKVHDQSCRGLALPEEVQRKIFGDNVRTWYPGL